MRIQMALSPGTRLGTYELVGELGAGGMGQVYRAHDTSLDREVALKLVNSDLCCDADSVARLRREARALAALHHPHVATVHELGEFEGICCIVMELVPGETLQELLAHKQLTVGEALRIASQIADALEAAHERGLIHRDLKPSNIKITPDGVVKVLDFGLAKKAFEDARPALDHSTVHTQTGVVMGTAAYMSPEQARGDHVDRRADVWAFGCVLFEMLARQRAFDGKTSADIMAAVLARDPDWSTLTVDTPPRIRELLRRCLAKDVRHRLRDLGDARLDIEAALSPVPVSGVTAAPTSRRSSHWTTVAALIAGVGLGAIAVTALRTSPAPSVLPVQFAIGLAPGEQLGATDFPAVVISPDRRSVVYVVARGPRTALTLRRLDALASAVIPGTDDATAPFFSPDSRFVAFFAGGKLKRVPVDGGPPITISDAGTGFGGTWGPNDAIVFASSTGSGLSRVSAQGGTPVRVTRLDAERGEFSHRWPEWLDDSRILFTVGTVGNWDEAEIVAQSLDSGERTIVMKGGTNPHYLNGKLLYTHDGSVWSVPFDSERLQVRGTPERVLEGVLTSADGAAQFSISLAGARVYVPGNGEATARRLIALDGSNVTPLAAPPHAYHSPRVSPDGRRVAVSIAEEGEHIWVYDIAAGTLKQLTFDGANRSPIWTADGQNVTFSSNRGGALNLYSVSADGGAAPQRLTTSDDLQMPGSWSADGSLLAFVEQRPATGRDIWILRRQGEAIPFAQSTFDESAPAFSPDGRSIAFVVNDTGQGEVYVKAVNGASSSRRVSSDGGTEPVWSRDGRSLFYRSHDRIVEMPVAGGREPRLVFDRAQAGTLDSANYDLARNTGRLIFVAGDAPAATTAEIRVLLNAQ
jgi:eukaryotic-like serine/threonine-protein kinase